MAQILHGRVAAVALIAPLYAVGAALKRQKKMLKIENGQDSTRGMRVKSGARVKILSCTPGGRETFVASSSQAGKGGSAKGQGVNILGSAGHAASAQ